MTQELSFGLCFGQWYGADREKIQKTNRVGTNDVVQILGDKHSISLCSNLVDKHVTNQRWVLHPQTLNSQHSSIVLLTEDCSPGHKPKISEDIKYAAVIATCHVLPRPPRKLSGKESAYQCWRYQRCCLREALSFSQPLSPEHRHRQDAFLDVPVGRKWTRQGKSCLAKCCSFL